MKTCKKNLQHSENYGILLVTYKTIIKKKITVLRIIPSQHQKAYLPSSKWKNVRDNPASLRSWCSKVVSLQLCWYILGGLVWLTQTLPEKRQSVQCYKPNGGRERSVTEWDKPVAQIIHTEMCVENLSQIVVHFPAMHCKDFENFDFIIRGLSCRKTQRYSKRYSTQVSAAGVHNLKNMMRVILLLLIVNESCIFFAVPINY